ncbi:GNAT family N-acetyltransferase [Steroidobacter flavus]|uniref:GNAT family N-acetyltransferase n=1 Tax=Steroidobacter flavus TaxID=1842136 RepID=A0ABV8T131_9GAMM
MYNPYVVGKRIYLRHPTAADVEGRWHEWLSDEETTRWLGVQYWPNCVENQREYYAKEVRSRGRLVLAIVDIESDRHIGIVSLSGIDWVHGFADIAIIIGEKEFRTGAYTIEAISLMLRTAFLRLNLRIVKGGYVASNEATQAIMAVFRFREVGRFKKLYWSNGAYADGVVCMLERDDWMRRNGLNAK